MTKTKCSPAAALLLAGWLLAGCAGAPPVADHEYLLPPQTLTAPGGDGSVLRLKAIAIAPYLDQKGVVLQTGTTEIRVAKHHRWAEPLDDAIARYLQVSIANQAQVIVESTPLVSAGRHDSVIVRINRFHGTERGDVRLVADWRVQPTEGEPTIYSFDRSTVQSENGYPALIAAHAELLDDLAHAIARSIEPGH